MSNIHVCQEKLATMDEAAITKIILGPISRPATTKTPWLKKKSGKKSIDKSDMTKLLSKCPDMPAVSILTFYTCSDADFS